MGEGEYIVLIDGVEHRYTHWDDIPQEFDNMIKFLPVIPEGPHTEAQHDAQVWCVLRVRRMCS